MQIEELNGCVPNNIAHIIGERGLKVNSVAKKAKIEPQVMYQILSNRRIIKPYQIINIAKALEINVSDLFKTDFTDMA